jgi:hypothetical protein
MKAEKVILPIVIVGVIGAATYVIYRYFKKKNDEKKISIESVNIINTAEKVI